VEIRVWEEVMVQQGKLIGMPDFQAAPEYSE
jgi:hypothetical protein